MIQQKSENDIVPEADRKISQTEEKSEVREGRFGKQRKELD